MKKKADIRTYTLEELAKLPSKTNWGKVQATTQQELGRAIAEDSDERDLTPDWTKAELVIRRPKKSVTLRMDEELLDWFKRQGRGYQTKMQAVLRSYMEAHS
jgi:uncharacterized protein (DUF4415 family)